MKSGNKNNVKGEDEEEDDDEEDDDEEDDDDVSVSLITRIV